MGKAGSLDRLGFFKRLKRRLKMKELNTCDVECHRNEVGICELSMLPKDNDAYQDRTTCTHYKWTKKKVK